MGKYTCILEEVDCGSIPLVGGKGANLGELTRAQLPVPHAFCVTTAAYRRFIDANSLLAPILSVLEGLDYDDAAEIERRGSRIREMIVSADTPGDVEDAIRTAGKAVISTTLKVSCFARLRRSDDTAAGCPGGGPWISGTAPEAGEY